MDESGFEAETIRPYGYAPIGKPCIDSYNWQGKKRTNVIGALYERCCLHWITLSTTLTAAYSTNGANKP